MAILYKLFLNNYNADIEKMKKNKLKRANLQNASNGVYYFVYPFGTDADDLTTIPTTATLDNSVSYQEGFTLPYEENIDTSPNALPIPRGQMNQLFFQITQAMQQIQQYGYPFWISSADNLGTPYSYNIYATVYYGGVIYQNQVANNISTPGSDNTWLVISGSSNGNTPGTVKDWAGPVVESGWHLCDGSAVSRATYATLFSNITQIQSGIITNSSYSITGLSSTEGMWAGMYLEGENIPSGAQISAVLNSTSIAITAEATGSSTSNITFFYFGNGNGSTTFNLPNLINKTTAGAGSTGYSFGAGLGESGGSKTITLTRDNLPDHTHLPAQVGGGSNFSMLSTTSVSKFSNTSGDNNVHYEAATATAGISGYAGQTTVSIVQPTTLLLKVIRMI